MGFRVLSPPRPNSKYSQYTGICHNKEYSILGVGGWGGLTLGEGDYGSFPSQFSSLDGPEEAPPNLFIIPIGGGGGV